MTLCRNPERREGVWLIVRDLQAPNSEMALATQVLSGHHG